jgi:hypothetical protein
MQAEALQGDWLLASFHAVFTGIRVGRTVILSLLVSLTSLRLWLEHPEVALVFPASMSSGSPPYDQ